MRRFVSLLALLAGLTMAAPALAAEPWLVAQNPPLGQPMPPKATLQPVGPKHHKGHHDQPTPQAPLRAPAPAVVKPGAPVVAPPGSVVVPPAAVVPRPGRSDRSRASSVARCNQQQAFCTSTCNARTYGQARNMCYNQCNAQFVHCTSRANVR